MMTSSLQSSNVKIVENIWPQDTFNKTVSELTPILENWKNNLQSNSQGRGLEQHPLVYSWLNDKAFITAHFNENHECTNLDEIKENLLNSEKNRLGNRYDPKDNQYNRFIEPLKQKLVEIIFDLVKIALHRFGAELKLNGKEGIRIQFKAFFHDAKKSNIERTAQLDLPWHYDFCAAETMVSTIFNELSDKMGYLQIAQNKYEKECTGFCGYPLKEVVLDETTIEKVNYPENGAILFHNQQGKRIHCPGEVTLKPGEERRLVKLVFQIVRYDHPWMKTSSENYAE